jgi:8-oxo-dGTP diphosphatase
MEQIGAFGDGRRHPATAPLSVAYVALVPAAADVDPDAGAEFFPLSALPPLAPRQRAIVDAAVAHVRSRVGQAPVAFRLLPPSFTLSELQERYELLLGRQLHKASFRRALQGARIVEPTDVWRSEGRGRPAQLFRYATRRKKVAPRGVRFDA